MHGNKHQRLLSDDPFATNHHSSVCPPISEEEEEEEAGRECDDEHDNTKGMEESTASTSCGSD